jgi:hypothetical protein
MAEFRAESISEARVGDDQISVRVSFATGTGPVMVSMDWRLASELIDRLAIINNKIRHFISAPDTRADRIRTGCRRTGIVLGAITLLPAIYGLWLWSAGQLDPEAWRYVAGFLLAAPTIYVGLWAIGWVTTAFVGEKDRVEP